jgi:hypothetical protein
VALDEFRRSEGEQGNFGHVAAELEGLVVAIAVHGDLLGFRFQFAWFVSPRVVGRRIRAGA